MKSSRNEHDFKVGRQSYQYEKIYNNERKKNLSQIHLRIPRKSKVFFSNKQKGNCVV